MDGVKISVIIPIRNELPNLKSLISEIRSTLEEHGDFEVIYVDDGSTDGSNELLHELRKGLPWMRFLRHSCSCGQTAAIRTGVLAARASIIVTLDGDGQNNPAFIPHLVNLLVQSGECIGLVQGQRTDRKDTVWKIFQSRVANAIRNSMLNDGVRDTGCGLKAFRKDVYLDLPYFSALHRFMPALVKRNGFEVRLIDVVDRPRLGGRSNYGLFDRLGVGIVDLLGVYWLTRHQLPLKKVVVKPGSTSYDLDRMANAQVDSNGLNDNYFYNLPVAKRARQPAARWVHDIIDIFGVCWLIRRRGLIPTLCE